MDMTSVLLFILFGTAAGLLLFGAVVGVCLWRARKETARRKAMVGAF